MQTCSLAKKEVDFQFFLNTFSRSVDVFVSNLVDIDVVVFPPALHTDRHFVDFNTCLCSGDPNT